MLYFLALAGTAKSVFKTGAFNRSAIPPLSILAGSLSLWPGAADTPHEHPCGGPLRSRLCPLADVQPPTVTNMKHVDGVAPDAEQDAVCLGPFSIEKLAHFKKGSG